MMTMFEKHPVITVSVAGLGLTALLGGCSSKLPETSPKDVECTEATITSTAFDAVIQAIEDLHNDGIETDIDALALSWDVNKKLKIPEESGQPNEIYVYGGEKFVFCLDNNGQPSSATVTNNIHD